jgi:hypothetical protein
MTKQLDIPVYFILAGETATSTETTAITAVETALAKKVTIFPQTRAANIDPFVKTGLVVSGSTIPAGTPFASMIVYTPTSPAPVASTVYRIIRQMPQTDGSLDIWLSGNTVALDVEATRVDRQGTFTLTGTYNSTTDTTAYTISASNWTNAFTAATYCDAISFYDSKNALYTLPLLKPAVTYHLWNEIFSGGTPSTGTWYHNSTGRDIHVLTNIQRSTSGYIEANIGKNTSSYVRIPFVNISGATSTEIGWDIFVPAGMYFEIQADASLTFEASDQAILL